MAYDKRQDVYLTVRIAEETKQKLRELADRDGRSLSNQVKQILTKAVKNA